MEEFYDMPWCEYLIKCQAWQRIEKEKWKHTGLIAYESRVGSHLKSSSLPRSFKAYMNFGDDGNKKRKVSNEMRELYERRIAEYNEAKAKAKQQKVVTLRSKKE